MKERPTALVVVTMTAATVATSPPILAAFAETPPAVAWIGMLSCTGGLAALLAWWSARAKEMAGALARVLLGGFAAGWLNSVVCFVVAASFDSPPLGGSFVQALAVSPFVAVIGVAIGGPIGFGYGFGLLIPVLLAHRLRGRPGAEATDGYLVGVGLWAAVVAFGLAVPMLMDPAFAPNPTAWLLTLLLCVPLGVAAVILFVLAVARLWRRRSWLARVRAGLVSEWVVVPRDTWRTADLEGIEPLLATPYPDAVLACASGEMGYREVRRLRPHALVTA